MGGKLGKRGMYTVKGNPEDQAAEASGTEMEEPSSGNSLSELGVSALQEEGDAGNSQVLLEGNQPEQGAAASIMEACKSADSPADMGSTTDQRGKMSMTGSGLEPPTDLNAETVAAAAEEGAEEDPMVTPPSSPLPVH